MAEECRIDVYIKSLYTCSYMYIHVATCTMYLPSFLSQVGKLTHDFEPYKNLWIMTANWLQWHDTWMNDSLVNIDPELLANNVNGAFKTMHKSVKHFQSIPGCLAVAQDIKTQIEEFRPFIPLIQGLRNPGMRNRS